MNSCKNCSGTGFVEKKNVLFCKNNTLKLQYHLCYYCENIRANLKSNFQLCDKCNGDGYFKKNHKEKNPSS